MLSDTAVALFVDFDRGNTKQVVASPKNFN